MEQVIYESYKNTVMPHGCHDYAKASYMAQATMYAYCRNMSGHALMGRPAARLEMMALVIRSYVLVYIVAKRQ